MTIARSEKIASVHLVTLSSCHLVTSPSAQLSTAQTPFAQLEEADQGIEMPAVGGHLDEIDAGGIGELAQLGAALDGGTRISLSHRWTRRIDQNLLACLGVLQLEESDGRQLLLARVGDAHQHEVVV